MNPPSLFQRLIGANALRTLDQALARTLARLDADTPDSVLAAAALASLAVANGHAGFDPAAPGRLVEGDLPWPAAEAWQQALAQSRWVARPEDGDAASAEDAPLVYEHGLLYLRRYREYERKLAHGLQRIGAHAPAATDVAALAPLFAQLFPDAASPSIAADAPRNVAAASARDQGEDQDDDARSSSGPHPTAVPSATPVPHAPQAAGTPDLQARAAATALRHNLVLVTGGPGTGKTTTTARLLVLLIARALHTGRPAPRIALAAPTGRAAERMAESVRNAVQALSAQGIDPALLAPLPTTGTTLHRLLGTIPDAPRFRHHADNPLPFDVVVVDEASMIDLPLMAKLVDAVADGARLVLLGDPDQLPSVEAGDVLSGILHAAGDGAGIAIDDADDLQPLLGPSAHAGIPAGEAARSSATQHQQQPEPATLHGHTFPGRHIHLQRGYRQSAALDLAPLAAAVRDGDSDTALSLLRGGALSGVHFHENQADPLQAYRDPLLAHWAALADATDPADALALAARLRILTTLREGPQGARGLNARIEDLLGGSTRRGVGPGYFHGRLLLITENSYRHRLFNGDIGICLRREASPFLGRSEASPFPGRREASPFLGRSEASPASASPSAHDSHGTLMAWFPGETPGDVRAFHPAALPAHESAFAMTVHKAQGSEFDEVWLQLPRTDSRVLSRELVYTAITRARSRLHVAGSAQVLRDALARHTVRMSGLAWRLGGDAGDARDPAPAAAEATRALPPADDAPPAQGALF